MVLKNHGDRFRPTLFPFHSWPICYGLEMGVFSDHHLQYIHWDDHPPSMDGSLSLSSESESCSLKVVTLRIPMTCKWLITNNHD